MSKDLKDNIESLGQEILLKYCKRGDADDTIAPIMIPPIPNSQFMEILPQTAKQYRKGQQAYETEIVLYRHFEELNLKKEVIVLHKLEFTHEQYSSFLPEHNEICNKEPRQTEGEWDFVMIGDGFAAVFEVKGLILSEMKDCCEEAVSHSKKMGDCSYNMDIVRKRKKMECCCEEAVRLSENFTSYYGKARVQTKKVVDLITSITPVPVYQFTVFSNISRDDVNKKTAQQYSTDETLVFSEDLNRFTEWFEEHVPSPDNNEGVDSNIERVKRYLLGLWCINPDNVIIDNRNNWKVTACSLSDCIMDIDDKLRRAVVTQKIVDEEAGKPKNKKRKKNLENPEMVDAPPALFAKYLNIRCVTRDQLEVFESEEKLLLVEGPAGSGKTIVMLGKIIHLALTTSPDKKILLMLQGYDDSPAPKRHLEILNNIRQDITCDEITYDHSGDGDISDKLERARILLSKQLTDSSSKIVLLRFVTCLAESIHSLITRFDYVFVDDFQRLYDRAVLDIMIEPSFANNTIISEVLIPIVQNSSTNNTSMWILCDNAQSWDVRSAKLFGGKYSLLGPAWDELRDYFKNSNSKELTVNLRNTFEMSTMLSIIRRHYENMDFAGTLPVTWPQQEIGHILRGTKPAIYLLKTNETSTWTEVLTKELEILKGSDSSLNNKDIAVLHSSGDSAEYKHIRDTVNSVVRWDPTDDQIKVYSTGECMSAEWPAVIFIGRHWSYSSTVTLPDNSEKEITYGPTIPFLYIAISRARVYSTAIIFNYTPNTCQYTDKLLDELKQRPDVCRIIER